MSRSTSPEPGPDFLCIGAQRSGSSWLNKQMKAHPDIWVPPMKELHYFDVTRNQPFWNSRYRWHLRRAVRRTARDIARGSWTPTKLTWELKYFLRPRTDDWYSSLFADSGVSVAGESTPDYAILPPQTIREIHARYPELKIVFIMRDPIDRSWSATVMWLAKRRGRSIADVSVEEILEFIHGQGCMSRSDYGRNLDNWLTYFDESQLFVGYFDEIKNAPEQLLKRLYRFLEVPEAGGDVGVDLDKPVNSAARHESGPPAGILRDLARIHRPKLQALVNRGYNGYPQAWLRRAEALAE